MSRGAKKPGSRATRNRLVKNWHIWLIVWFLVMAGLVYGGYRIFGPEPGTEPVSVDEVGAVTKPTQSPSPDPTPTVASTTPAPKTTPPVTASPPARKTAAPIDKSMRVVVYNNTVSTGYAARTADKAKALGWNVVFTENWQGSVPSSTVFYSTGLETEARALAKDLGIARVAPNHSGISLKGLSVVLRS